MKVQVRIGELVLDGFSFHDHKRISVAIEQELSRLIRQNGLPHNIDVGGEIPHIDAGSLNLTEATNPKTIGAEVARFVYEGLRQQVDHEV